jgi:iron complex transport system substrate-binding protein
MLLDLISVREDDKVDKMKLIRVQHMAWLGLLILVLAVSITGCQKKPDTQASNNQAAGQTAAFPMTITDDLGRQVTLKTEPQRIVSLAPSNTEILFYLGLGERVVGDTTYCDYPEEAKQVAKVGGFSDPSLEKIVSLNPDLVLATGMHTEMIKSLEDAGLTVIVLKPNSIEGIINSIQLIGRVSGVDNKAISLTNGLKDRVNAVSQKTALIPEAQRPTVYYELWDEPIMSVGKNSLIGEIISLAGGKNIADDSTEEYPQLSEEIIIARNPQIMLNSYGHDAKIITAADIAARKGWSNLAFVKSGRIYTIDSDLLTLSGPRIVEGLEQVAACLHPELFK